MIFVWSCWLLIVWSYLGVTHLVDCACATRRACYHGVFLWVQNSSTLYYPLRKCRPDLQSLHSQSDRMFFWHEDVILSYYMAAKVAVPFGLTFAVQMQFKLRLCFWKDILIWLMSMALLLLQRANTLSFGDLLASDRPWATSFHVVAQKIYGKASAKTFLTFDQLTNIFIQCSSHLNFIWILDKLYCYST